MSGSKKQQSLLYSILKDFQDFCQRFWAHLIAYPLLLISAAAYGSIAYVVMPEYIRIALSFFSINVGVSGIMFLVTGLTLVYILVPFLQTVFSFNKKIAEESVKKKEEKYTSLAENLVEQWVHDGVLKDEKQYDMVRVVKSLLLESKGQHLSLNIIKERHRQLKGFSAIENHINEHEKQRIRKVDDGLSSLVIEAMLSDLRHLKFKNDIDQYFSEQDDKKDNGPFVLVLRYLVKIFALFSGFNVLMLLAGQLFALGVFNGVLPIIKACSFLSFVLAGALNVQVFSGENASRGLQLVYLYWEIYKDLGLKKFLDKCSFQQVLEWVSGICQAIASFLFSTSLYLHLLPKLLVVSKNIPVFYAFFQWLNSQSLWVVPLSIMCCAVVTLLNYIKQIISGHFINGFNATASFSPKRKAEKLIRPLDAVLPFLKGALIIAVTGTQLVVYFDSIVTALSSVAMSVWVDIFSVAVVLLISRYWWTTFKETITQMFEVSKVNIAKNKKNENYVTTSGMMLRRTASDPNLLQRVGTPGTAVRPGSLTPLSHRGRTPRTHTPPWTGPSDLRW